MVVFGMITVGIVTVSDRASRGAYIDKSGPAIRDVCSRWLATPWQEAYRLVGDDRPVIESALRELTDLIGCPLIITSGGTGPALRDVTPEATMAVCERVLPGFGERMRAASLQSVPTAILSRQLAGTRGRSLIINLPGKPTAIEECLGAIWEAIPDCIGLLGGPRLLFTDAAPRVQPLHGLTHRST